MNQEEAVTESHVDLAKRCWETALTRLNLPCKTTVRVSDSYPGLDLFSPEEHAAISDGTKLRFRSGLVCPSETVPIAWNPNDEECVTNCQRILSNTMSAHTPEGRSCDHALIALVPEENVVSFRFDMVLA